MADVHVLYLWTDRKPVVVEPKKLQTFVYDSGCDMVYVWEYLAVYGGDICYDKNLAGERTDGGNGYPGDVFMPALSGTGACQPGNVDAVHLRVSVGGFCDEHRFYAHTDDHRYCVGADWEL